MKTILSVLASISLALLAAACVAPTSSEASAEEPTAEAEQAFGTGIYTITYYSDAAHTTVVGSCVVTDCPPTHQSICSGATGSQYSSQTVRACR